MQRRSDSFVQGGLKSPTSGFEGSNSHAMMQSMTLPSPNTTMSGGGVDGADAARRAVKLPSSVPEQQRGERPYYHECYFKYCTATLAMRESTTVTEDLVNGSAAFYQKIVDLHVTSPVAAPPEEGTPPFGLTFSWNALLQQDASTPTRSLRYASHWDARSHLVKRFQESIAPTCEQAVFAGQRLFKGRTDLPSDLIPIESTTSFISTTFGALVHVWHSATEAKKFMQSQQIVGEAVAALRLPSIAVPVSVFFIIHTVAVTATTLMPLAHSNARKIVVDGPQLQLQLKQLEVYCRARCPFPAYPGADGRWYIVETLGVLRPESESQGETNNVARAALFEAFPNMDDFPDTLRKAARRLIDAAVQGILDSVGALATAAGGISGVKVHDLVAARIIPKACHAVGVKVSYLYELLEHPKLSLSTQDATTSPVVAAARELVLAEMVCRTFKELVRAEVSCIKTIPHSEAPTAAVGQFLVEVANRCVFNLLTKEDLWVPHVLAVLRIKFSTPETFSISQGAVTKRCILGYLTSKLGLVFEGGRYCRTTRVSGHNTTVAPAPDVQLVHRGKTAQATTSAQSEWKKVCGISNPELMFACARRQLHVFALCSSFEDIENCMTVLDAKMEERSCDLSTRGDMLFTYIEAIRQLLPHQKAAQVCRRLCTEYTKKYAKAFASKECDAPIAISRLECIIDTLPLLQTSLQDAGGEAAGDAVSRTANTSVDEECADARLAAWELLKRIFISINDENHATSRWVHPLLVHDGHVDLMCDTLDQLYTKEGHASTCAEVVNNVLQARTSRPRYELICRRMLRCVVRSLESERLSNALPPNNKLLYFDTAERIFLLHLAVHSEVALPTFVALLAYAAFQGLTEKASLSLRQSVDVDNFIKTVYPVLSALVESTAHPVPSLDEQPQHAVWISLKSEPCLEATASIIIVMMDITQWAMVKRLVAYTHHVLCEGRVDGYARLTQPAHPCLGEVAHTMRAALAAVAKFQWHAKRSIDAKKEDRQRALESRSKREAFGFTKSALTGSSQGPLPLILHACKESHEVCLRTDNRCTPSIHPATLFSTTTLSGLRTLLACAQPKTFASLSNVVVQSGFFPPFKYSVVPFAYGHRHIVVVPDTQCIGVYWSKLWMAPSGKYFESNVPLFAKIAAQYIYSQLRFTHLFFSVVGFGMAGPIADCLMQLIPAADAQVLITLGSPACYSNPKGTPVPCATVHAVLEDDIVPHLIGCGPLPHIRARFIGRLEGLGAVLPFPPSKRQLQSAALYGRFHNVVDSVITVFRGGGATKELIRSEHFSKQLDLRRQFVGLGPQHYLEAIVAYSKTPAGQEQLNSDGGLISATHSFFSVALAAADKNRLNTAVASVHRPWYPPEVAVLAQELSPDGTPSDKLRSSLKIPSSVEPNVLHHELMTLTYPKIVQRILKGVLTLNDEYGFDSDGQSNAAAVERILKCRTMEQLVYVLQSYVGASWYPDYFAVQLCEWSGVEQGLHRQALNRTLVESLISKHSFLFTMCPDTSKSSENGTVMDKLTKHMSEDGKATFAGPMGYHVGWSIALCRTLPAVNISSVVSALQSASCQSNGISDVHPRVGKNLLAPAIRFTYTPPPTKAGGGGGAKQLSHASSNVQGANAGRGSQNPNWVFVQWNFLDVVFDGSNAAQSLMRCAEQCIWVAQDEYSFQHLLETVDMSGSDNLRQYLIYCPKAADDERDLESPTEDAPPSQPIVPPVGKGSVAATTSPLVAKMKAFADSRSIPFMEFYPRQPDSAAALIAMLMREVASFVRVPLNPTVLPRNVHTGGLYAHDDDEVGRVIRKGMTYFIKPNTPPGNRGNGDDDRGGRRGAPNVLSLQPKDSHGAAGGRGKR